jgi:hypothetical protein
MSSARSPHIDGKIRSFGHNPPEFLLFKCLVDKKTEDQQSPILPEVHATVK